MDNRYKITHLRGSQFLTATELGSQLSEIGSRDSLAPKPKFGGYTFPYSYASKNFLVGGSPGSGKSTLVNTLMQSILVDQIGVGLDHRAVIHDHKGESIRLMYGLGFTFENGLLKTLNPFDVRGAGWDIAADIDNRAYAREFAEVLIPVNKNDSQPFWCTAARNLLAAIVRSLILWAPYRWTLRDVVQLCLYQPMDSLMLLLERDPQNGAVVSMLNSKAVEMVQGVLGTIRTEMEKYVEIATFWYNAKEKVSVKDFIKNSYVLLLGSYHDCEEAMQTVNRLFMNRLISGLIPPGGGDLNDENNNRRVWIILDEAAKVGKLTKLPMLLDLGRQMGISVTMTFHSIQQLRSVYEDDVTAILGQFKNIALLGMGDRESAEWASELCGNQEVLEHRVTLSENAGVNTIYSEVHSPFGNQNSGKSFEIGIRERKLIMPEDFLNLPPVCREYGLRGVLCTPIGTTQLYIPWHKLESSRPPVDMSVESFVSQDLSSTQFPFWV